MVTVGLTTATCRPDTGAEVARFGVAQRLRLADQRTTLGYDTAGREGWSDLLVGAGVNWNRRWAHRCHRAVQPAILSAPPARPLTAPLQPGPLQVISAAYRYQRENSAKLPTRAASKSTWAGNGH